MRKFAKSSIAAVLGACLVSTSALAGMLPITPAGQQFSDWCWLAVGEMVFRYFKVPQFPMSPNYQCGELLANPVFKGSCPNVSAGSTIGIQSLLLTYPRFVGAPSLASIADSVLLPFANIKKEIDNGRPIVIGINPSQALGGQGAFVPSFPFGTGPNAPEHASLIIGYDDNGIITVADPLPYEQFVGAGLDPYLRIGAQQTGPLSYRLSPQQLAMGLKWVVSLRCVSVPSPTGAPPPTC